VNLQHCAREWIVRVESNTAANRFFNFTGSYLLLTFLPYQAVLFVDVDMKVQYFLELRQIGRTRGGLLS
jgi:hypothetical protein